MKKLITCIITIIFITFCFLGQGWSNSRKNRNRMDPGLNTEPVYWYEGEVKKQAWMATVEIAVFPVKGERADLNESDLVQRFHPKAVITESNSFVIFLKAPEPVGKDFVLNRLSPVRSLQKVKQSSPVFYTSRNKHPETRIVLTGEIIVQFPSEFTESQIVTIENEYSLERLKTFVFSKNAYLYRAGGDALKSLKVANNLYESGRVIYAYPNWLRKRTKRYTPNDPLSPSQWHLENTGQGGCTPGEDVNIVSVWDTYKGSSNEVVAIVDDGMETGHPDLSANVIPIGWDWVGGDSDPNPVEAVDNHGTACAGTAAAVGDNNLGVSGAAFHGGLVGHRLLGARTDANEADALTRNNGQIDIYSNSWGPPDALGGYVYREGLGPLTEVALESGVTNGRGGLGSIFVWAGGNGGNYDNANYDGYANSRYTISVAGSDCYGKRPSFSERGACHVINAPGTDLITTDRTGADGYDPASDYTDSFSGTSAAAPLVSGIVALMLQANPNLTWRDVQHILIETAEKNDPSDPGWTTNGAGYDISYEYGFGRIDAQAAVNAAVSWNSVGKVSAQGSSSPNIPIPDGDGTSVTDTINISDDFPVEFVEIYFSAADHTWWGDLEVTLISPEGTESVLAEQELLIDNSDNRWDNWRFGSLRSFGESSQGTWTLRVKDVLSDYTGTFQSWTLKTFGTKKESFPWELFYPAFIRKK